MNGEDTSSSSSEEEKDGDHADSMNGVTLKPSWTTGLPSKTLPIDNTKDDDEEEEVNCLPTIYFSHTVELKKVGVVCTFKTACTLLDFYRMAKSFF